MAGTSNRGLGSDNMSEAKKREIQSKGGKATGAKNLTTEARQKGGEHSNSSSSS